MQPSPSSHKVPERSLRGLDLDLTRWNVTVTILLKAGSSVKKISPSSPARTSGWGFLWLAAGLELSVRNEIGLRVVPSLAM